MKKTYIIPALQVTYIAQELLLVPSNTVTHDGVDLNPNTMKGGDGSDAVKANPYNVWDDDWQK